jgi:hypothetical protein
MTWGSVQMLTQKLEPMFFFNQSKINDLEERKKMIRYSI